MYSCELFNAFCAVSAVTSTGAGGFSAFLSTLSPVPVTHSRYRISILKGSLGEKYLAHFIEDLLQDSASYSTIFLTKDQDIDESPLC